MTPEGRRARIALALAIVLMAPLPARPAQALRILNYNLLNYPGTSGAARNPHFRNIIQQIHPDLLVAEEVLSQVGTDQFLANVLNTIEPGQWAALPFVDGNDTDGAFFYKPSKFTVFGQWSFYPNAANQLRLIHVYRVRPVGYTTNASDIRLYSVHLKASQGFEAQRLAEATGMRDTMNAMPSGTHAFGVGDFNLYTGTEPALGKLLESQVDNDGRLYDPLGLQNITWNNNSGIAEWDTQCPCLSNCVNGSVGGGMDDRFDLILPTLNWNNGQGYGLVPGSYTPFGNDGAHYNSAINQPPYTVIDSATAYGLWFSSDHLPLYVDIQVPAISSVASSLDLGTVIGGGSASLPISNTATPPADGLTYSFSAPSGFTAPAGTFELAAGAGTSHAVGTAAGPAGPRTGDLTLASDDLDHPLRAVALTANVLDHARPSLDQAGEQLAAPVDFGTHPEGGFSPRSASVFNFGYSATQASLSLTGGVITGGDGRFSIVDGFTPATIGESGKSFILAFDATGANLDEDYAATLTFTSEDEPLPGATTRPNLVVTLTARVGSEPVGTPTALAAPTRTQLYTPFPNPLSGSSRVRLDLARGAEVRLEVLDLGGRHVATLAHGAIEPGRYAYSWSGRGDAGESVPAGVYFVRLSGRGLGAQSVRLAVVR